jgi:hypothetical protein
VSSSYSIGSLRRDKPLSTTLRTSRGGVVVLLRNLIVSARGDDRPHRVGHGTARRPDASDEVLAGGNVPGDTSEEVLEGCVSTLITSARKLDRGLSRANGFDETSERS